MTMYSAYGGPTTGQFLCVKASSTLAVKPIRVDIFGAGSNSYAVYLYIGGGAITGGSTLIPAPARAGAPAALATVKTGATAISGTQNLLTSGFFGTSGGKDSWSPPASIILGAGSSTVFAITTTGGSGSSYELYFDEQQLQGGF